MSSLDAELYAWGPVLLKTEKDFCDRKGPKRTFGHRKGLRYGMFRYKKLMFKNFWYNNDIDKHLNNAFWIVGSKKKTKKNETQFRKGPDPEP